VSVIEPLGNLPEAARRRLAAIGPVWGSDIQHHRDIVLDTYRPLLRGAPKAAITVVRKVPYGRDPRQILDVYRPATAMHAPIVLFVHGGAFVRGNKDLNDEVYANVLYYFARHGYLGLNVEYRLAPDFKYPSGAEDVAASAEWARHHAAEFGGDPARMFMIGHSAGGTHVAACVYDPRLIAQGGPRVSGIVLISARLRADALSDDPNAAAVRAYFGDDAARYDELSPVTHAARSVMPVFIAVAEYENPYLDVYSAELFYRIAAARGRAPRFLRLPRHNHMSIVAHFNTTEDILGREIRDFFATEC